MPRYQEPPFRVSGEQVAALFKGCPKTTAAGQPCRGKVFSGETLCGAHKRQEQRLKAKQWAERGRRGRVVQLPGAGRGR